MRRGEGGGFWHVLRVLLGPRMLFLFLVVTGALSLVHMYRVSRDYQARVRAECVSRPGVARVVVSSGDAGYARAQGWPRVLSRADQVLGSPLVYDHGTEADRIRLAARGLCREQRFRLVAR